jgi:hypothetical protein
MKNLRLLLAAFIMMILGISGCAVYTEDDGYYYHRPGYYYPYGFYSEGHPYYGWEHHEGRRREHHEGRDEGQGWEHHEGRDEGQGWEHHEGHEHGGYHHDED